MSGRSAFVTAMAGFEDPAFYGDRWGGVYDEGPGKLDSAQAVEFLAGLAGDGPVLELAIGTGRVALPLAARGVDVQGVDASEAMVARLRAKPGGAGIPVTIGDMADVPVCGPFRLVYLVFNTLFGLLSQDRQAGCFRSVAGVLEPGGAFVIECFVPDLRLYDRGQRVHVMELTEDSVTFGLSRLDLAAQRITVQVVTLDGDGLRLHPIALRYSWPSELDLMAARAGLTLANRYGGWESEPFGSGSDSHVSVYRRDRAGS
jgi:SAM-dependent methyltransferase